MTQITAEQMDQAWGVFFAAVLFLIVAVPVVAEMKYGKLATSLLFFPGAFCFVVWAVAVIRYVFGAA